MFTSKFYGSGGEIPAACLRGVGGCQELCVGPAF